MLVSAANLAALREMLEKAKRDVRRAEDVKDHDYWLNKTML